MPASSSASSRKRTRARIADDELDELSPQRTDTNALLSTSQKRRKLNTQASSTTNSPLSFIKRRTLGLFGIADKTGKENLENVGREDELAGEKDIFEIEVSESEETEDSEYAKTNGFGSSKGSHREGGRRKRSVLSSIPKSSTTKAATDEEELDIYEITVSDEEQTRASGGIGRKGEDKLGREESLLKEKRTPGRPRKSDILKKDKALSREATRRRIIAGNDDLAEDNGGTETQRNKKTGGVRKTNPDVVAQLTASPSTSKRGRPRKDASRISSSAKTNVKSILTPKKDRLETSRKTVVFEGDGAPVDLGFKDLPKSAKSVQTKTKVAIIQNKSAEESDEEEEEEAACSVCSKLNSRKGNQILFCDGCDRAVHQKCYGVPVIPEGDWFCRDCQSNVNQESELEVDDDSVNVESQRRFSNIKGLEDHLKASQRIVLDKIIGQRYIRLRGHDEQMQKVHQVVGQTVLAGEGNSMLVIGGRGCGKTTLVEAVISDVATDHRDKFHVIRLNGFIHTDDRIALREIWRQLGREMEVEDELNSKSNHADTLASLLALLSHPSEISEQADQSEQTTKSVIFILDEFDLFTTHARQTLLYNLFDIAQARKAPIAVLGLTTRIDVVESLEKRVKSRFSHRYVYLSLPRSLPSFWEVCKEALTVGADELVAEGFAPETAGQAEFVSLWQAMIDDLYDKDDLFKRHIESYFYRTKSIPAFLTSCIPSIASLSRTKLPLTGKGLASSPMLLSAPDSKLHMLRGLSDLELALLISAARLDIILDTDTCNFAMAYDEYSSLTSKHKIQTSSTGVAALGASAKVWGRDIALGAWERLANYNLLIPAGIGGGGGRDIGVGGRMWKLDVGLEEIIGSVDGLSGIMTKWCREI